MRKIGHKDFQLLPQETQFEEDHKFRQNIGIVFFFFSQEFSIEHR